MPNDPPPSDGNAPKRRRKSTIPGWSEGTPQSERSGAPQGAKRRRKKATRPAERRLPPLPDAPGSPRTTKPTADRPTDDAIETPTDVVNVDSGPSAGTGSFITVDEQPYRRRKPLLQNPLAITGIVIALLAAGLLADHFLRDRSGGSNTVAEDDVERPDDDALRPPEIEEGLVRVYTKGETGFTVLVDGEIVRTEDGSRAVTPCEVTVDARENHRVTVAKAGFRDETRNVAASSIDAVDLVLEPEPDPDGSFASMLVAPWFDLEVGKPVPLTSLNTPGNEGDPFLSEDGLSLYYTSDGQLDGGVVHASRVSPYEPFADPTTIPLTRGALSPGALAVPNPDTGMLATHLTFATKSSVRSAVREQLLGDFTGSTMLATDPERTHPWTAARLLADGLALYWTQVENGEPATYFAARHVPTVSFQTGTNVPIPGGVPCLSSDGLRQYTFDGRELKRAVRRRIFEWRPDEDKFGRAIEVAHHFPFSEPKTIGELELDGYEHDPTRRQFAVSDDEQWMFYANSTASGDLYVVRLREGTGWGHAPIAKAIPNREFAPETVAVRENPNEKPFEQMEPMEDPRAKPLAYSEHEIEFKELMATRKYDEAAELVRKRIGEPEFSTSRKLLEWDLADIERVRRFHEAVEDGIATLEPGGEFSNKSVKLAFVEFMGGLLVGELGGKVYPLELLGMRYTDLVSLADRVLEDDDAESQVDVATFLHYEPGGAIRAVDTRLNRAGNLGGDFVERIAGRMLAQAKLEFDREKYRTGLDWLAELRDYAPNSDAAFEADEVESGLYQRMKWEAVGRRRWEGFLSAEYAADAERSPDSYLLSPRPYENFEMQMEYRLTDVNGSGGVYFRYAQPERRKPYEMDAAHKIQLANDSGIAPDSFTTGALFSVQEPRKNAAKPLNEWNTFRMTVSGQKCSVWINEDLVLETTLGNPEIPFSGRIALDGITGGITYRKILVLDLPKTI